MTDHTGGSGDGNGRIDARLAAVGDRVAGIVAGRALIDRDPRTGIRFATPRLPVPDAAELVTLFDSLDDDGQRALAMWAHQQRMRHFDRLDVIDPAILPEVAARPLRWTPDELRWLFAQSAGGCPDWTQRLFLPLVAAESVPPALLEPLASDLRELLDHLFSGYLDITAEERRPIAARIRMLLGRILPEGDRIPGMLLHDGDAFGPNARRVLTDVLTAPGVTDLLRHCATLDRVEPTRRWRSDAARLLADAPRGIEAARGLLDLYAAHPERRCAEDCRCPWRHGHFTHEDTDTLVRGLLWVVAERTEEWVTEVLARVTTAAATAFTGAPGFPHSPRVANAAILALSRRPGPLPVETLARLTTSGRNRALQTRLRDALTALGALRGWSPEAVLELAVDDHGLDSAGRLVERLGRYEAVVELSGGRARLGFTRDGRPLKGIPAAVTEQYPDRLRELRDLVKRIGRTVGAERRRVEALLSQEREWAYPDWVARYLEQPVTGQLGRELIWQASVDGNRWHAGLPERRPDGWTLVGPDGVEVSGERVRLWHPLRATVAETMGWRDLLVGTGRRQPFKQAFREVYLLTPAERETRIYSNRFAGHILRYRQANALMRARGWQSGYLGPWDGGRAGEAVREFDGGRWRASFFHELVPNLEWRDHQAHYCSTDQVRFARRDGAVWDPAPLVDVPAPVFSEAMRDVDLFVGVTSIANDPGWLDRGEDRFDAYWRESAVAPLAASAEVRRDALARLLPRTRVADRIEVTERYVRVRGNLRRYRIHIGSGTIMMEPDDAYLCVVPAARDRNRSLHLPFDEDEMLSLIVSKVFLLAADDRITDESILAQLRRLG